MYNDNIVLYIIYINKMTHKIKTQQKKIIGDKTDLHMQITCLAILYWPGLLLDIDFF